MNATTDALKASIAADVPALLWGAPGTGKTAMLMDLAREANAHAEVLIASHYDPGEILGLMLPEHGSVRFVAADWAQRIRAALDAGLPAWLILDELSCAPPAVQATLLRVVQERRVGTLSLAGCRVVGAANPADSAAAEGWLSPASANRWAHLTWAPDSTTWCRGELGGWGHSLAPGGQARAMLAGWITHNPRALLAVPEREADRERGWPSPRSWSALARGLSALHAEPKQALMSPAGGVLAAALVGPGAAAELTTWVSSLDLPSPEDLLNGHAKVPKRGDQAYAALASMVAAAMMEHAERETRIASAWKVLSGVRQDIALGPAAVMLTEDLPIPDEAVELGKAVLSTKERL